MNVFAGFDEILSMTLQDIKETKRYRRTHTHTDNVKTVYPPQFAGPMYFLSAIFIHMRFCYLSHVGNHSINVTPEVSGLV